MRLTARSGVSSPGLDWLGARAKADLNPPAAAQAQTPAFPIDFRNDFFGKETNLTVSGQLEGELGAASLAGAGNVGVLISSGGLIQTLEGVARTADGDVKVDGDLTQTLGGIAGTLTAKAKAIGSLSQTLTDASFVGQGSAPAGGTLSQTLDGITIDADGTAPVTAVGTLSQTLDAVSLTGEGENAGYTGLSGTLTADHSALTGNIQGRVRIGGQLEKSLANAVTHQVYRGTLVATLADLFTPQLTMRFRVAGLG